MSQTLVERVERIQLDFEKRAHEAAAEQLRLGMNEMVQVVRRESSSPTPEAKDEPKGDPTA